jgi:hypothetical protein
LISLNKPAGTFIDVATSQDGSLMFVLTPESQEVTIVDAKTYTSTVIPCSCSPTGFRRLKGNSVFLLDKPPADLLHVLDVSSPEPQVLVIPPRHEEQLEFEGQFQSETPGTR